jgi:hypothetical protein
MSITFISKINVDSGGIIFISYLSSYAYFADILTLKTSPFWQWENASYRPSINLPRPKINFTTWDWFIEDISVPSIKQTPTWQRIVY